MKRMVMVIFLAIGFGLVIGGGPLVYAQETDTTDSDEITLEEITVTAERHSSNLQDVASSVSVQNGDDLVQQGRSTLPQILEDMANVKVSGIAERGDDNQGSGIVIRGVLPNTTANSSTTSVVPSTAVYVDGVYEGVGSSYDVSRVEVLRGPQGTLYGRSATGGVVAIHTKNPVLGAYKGTLSADIGNYGKQDIQAALNIPVTDKFAIRISGHEYARDGYYYKEGAGNIETMEGRIKMLYEPSEDLSILLGAALQYNDIKTGGSSIYIDGPDTFRVVEVPDAVGSGDNHFHQFWAQIDWNIGIGTLTYMPAFRTWYRDLDAESPLAFLGPDAYMVEILDRPDEKFWTQELRLTSNPGSAVTWQTGVFYFYNPVESFHTVTSFNEPNAGLQYGEDITKKTKNIGAFAEATYPFSDTLRLTAGLRYDYTFVSTEEAYSVGHLDGSITTSYLRGKEGERKFNNTTFKLRLEKDLTPGNLIYGSIATGFLPGDVNIITQMTETFDKYPATNEYTDEVLTAYEIGSKNRFLDNKLQVNGAVYFYDYSGYQAVVNNSNNPAIVSWMMMNEPAQMWGGEIETQFQITLKDRLSASLGYLNAEFTDPSANFQTLVTQTEFTGIPPWQGTLGYNHMFNLPDGSILDLHGDANFRSGYDVVQVQPVMAAAGYLAWAQNDAVWIENLNARWISSNDMYSIDFYVRNLADKQYKTSAPTNVSTADDLSRATAGLSDPRTYGVVLSVKF